MFEKALLKYKLQLFSVVQMFEGKGKRLELIRELQSTHALQLAGQIEKRGERQSVLSDQRMRRLDTHKVKLNH